MGETVSTGPAVSAGPLLGTSGAPDPNFKAGPSVTYQGDTIPDVRFGILGSAVNVGSIRAHLDSPYILTTDAIPAASAATPVNIAAAANAVSGTPMTLVTAASAGITPNIPFYAFQSTTLLTSAVTLDFGFATVATTAGTNVATPAAGTLSLFSAGQQVVIGLAGNAGGTMPLITKVLNIGATTITLAANALSTQATAPVGQANIVDPLSTATATAWGGPYVAAGITMLFNPREGVTRGVGIAGSASAAGGTFRISGYDIYGQAMTANLVHPGGTAVAYTTKTFKHIMSVTPLFTDAHVYSVGTSDLFGFGLRNDAWEYNNLYVAGNFLSASTGWTAADLTNPATASTGDVRGTIQVGTRGPLGSGASGGPITGSQRLALFATIPSYNLINASPANAAPLYGVTQA